MAWQCLSISVRHSETGLSDRRQAAICSCRVAILCRISLLGVDAAEVGGLAAKAALLSASSKAPVIAVAVPRRGFERAMDLSFIQDRRDGTLRRSGHARPERWQGAIGSFRGPVAA